MVRTPSISTMTSRPPEDEVARVIADKSEHQRLDLARRRKRLLALVSASRAQFRRETESRRRLLAALEPPPPADRLNAAIEEAWERLYADYAQYRMVTPLRGRRGWRHDER